MSLSRYIYCTLFFVFFAFQINAQEPYAQHFSQVNGLPSNVVYSLLEDKDGFIWFTCDEGLYRYDGTYYKSFKAKNQISFAGSGLIKDIKGRIWYQNFDGHSYYVENKNLKELTQSAASTYCPIKITNKHVFIVENGNMVVLDIQTLKPIKRFKTINFIYASSTLNNDLYFIDGNSLFKIDEHLHLTRVGVIPFDEYVYPFLITNNKDLYLTKKKGTDNGIFKLVSENFIKIATVDSSVIIQNTRIIKDNLYLLTSSGFYTYRLKSERLINYTFSNKNITDLLIDRKGNHWITTSLDGINIAPNLNVKQYIFDSLQPLRSVNYGNQLVISSKNEKVLWFNSNTLKFKEIRVGNSNALPYYIYIDSLNNELIYVQSDGYTYFSKLNPKKLLQKSLLAIKKIVPFDHKYKAFVSSGFMGFYCRKADLKLKSSSDLHILNLEQTIDGNYVFFRVSIEGRAKSVYFDDASKNLYFVTNLGNYIWKDGNVSICADVQSLHEIFSWKGQLLGVGVDGKMKYLSSPFNKPNKCKLLKEIDCIKQVKQKNNKLFIRTANQIFVFEADKDNVTHLFSTFNLQFKECNDFSVINEDIWILTSNGFIKWNFNCRKNQITAGLFELTRIRINGERIDDLANQSFNYKQNSLSIDFALLDFGIATISNMQYKINKQEWTTIDPTSKTLSFPALASGEYILQIRGKINDEYVVFRKISFKIKPPFWSTVWFVFILFTIFTILLIWYYDKKINENRKRNKLINEKIILESNLNKSLLASIKSQMNPHFIFNALNTIQAYIYINDKENASRYLSNFSKLTRSVLEMSEKEEIPLSEDLIALTLYLDLEKMRFQDGFKYTIETPDFNSASVKIPSMLLQPYVENAIKHGLMHSDKDKKLSILIQKENNALLVTIDDNGIGRKRAEQLKMLRDKYQDGFSSQANEKRLDLLNENTEVSVIYTDKYDENNQATGTTVQLKIQLKS